MKRKEVMLGRAEIYKGRVLLCVKARGACCSRSGCVPCAFLGDFDNCVLHQCTANARKDKQDVCFIPASKVKK